MLPSLARAAEGVPLFLAGDLTDRGSPLETSVTERVADAGHPLVFVSGNHDSDTLELRLTKAGAIVLTRRGQLLPDGRYGDASSASAACASPATTIRSCAAPAVATCRSATITTRAAGGVRDLAARGSAASTS